MNYEMGWGVMDWIDEALLRDKWRVLLNAVMNFLHKNMEQIECSETSEIINQTPGNHPKEYIL
jgi:hypothetical protein